MRLALHVLLALVVAVAGCGSVTDSEPSSATTRAPAITPTGPPPGVTTEHVTDVRALTGAHSEILHANSYALDYRRTIRYENGTVYSRSNETHRVGADDSSRYELRVDGSNPLFLGGVPGGITSWSNGTVAVAAITQQNHTTYQRYDARQDRASFGRVYGLLSSFDLTTTGRTGTADSTRYHLASTNATNTDSFGIGNSRARNATLSASVDGDGVLRHYELTYAVVRDGTTLRVTETMRLEALGETTVERPAWVSTALQRTKNHPGPWS